MIKFGSGYSNYGYGDGSVYGSGSGSVYGSGLGYGAGAVYGFTLPEYEQYPDGVWRKLC